MDTTWTEAWLLWAQNHPGWLLAVVGTLLFVEGFAVIGLFVPGLLMVFFLGCLVGLGRMELVPVLFATMTGAFAGDAFNYWLGRHFSDALLKRWPLKQNPDLYIRGVGFFQRNGALSIPLGRFIGPLRSFVPMIAGIMEMRPRIYLPMAAFTAVTWVSSLVFPGMLLGASLEIAAAYATRLSVLLSLVIGVLVLTVWLARLAYTLISKHSPWLLRRMVTWLTKHPRLGQVFKPLFTPAKGEILSIALLGIILLIVLILLVAAILQLLIGDLGTSLDLRIQAWLLDFRSPVSDPFWGLLVSFSHWPVMLLTILSMAIWLCIHRQPVTCSHWLLATLLPPLLALALQWPLTHLPIWPHYLTVTGAFPDIKITLLTATLGSIPMLLVRELSVLQRRWYYLALITALSLFIMARLVLNLTYLSAAWSGVLLATLWLTVIGIGYRVRVRTGWPVWRHTIFFITSILIFGSTYSIWYGPDNASRWEPHLSGETLSPNMWFNSDWQHLPQYRSTYFRSDKERFNLQYAGTIDHLKQQLQQQGWQVHIPGSGNWWQVISPQPDAKKLPVFHKDFQGLPAEVVMLRNTTLGQQVLRLWPSGWQLQTDEQPNGTNTLTIWLGISNLESINNIGYWFNIWQHQQSIELNSIPNIEATTISTTNDTIDLNMQLLLQQ